jgi:hypothetical protein
MANLALLYATNLLEELGSGRSWRRGSHDEDGLDIA